jgi:hypothetical protein
MSVETLYLGAQCMWSHLCVDEEAKGLEGMDHAGRLGCLPLQQPQVLVGEGLLRQVLSGCKLCV